MFDHDIDIWVIKPYFRMWFWELLCYMHLIIRLFWNNLERFDPLVTIVAIQFTKWDYRLHNWFSYEIWDYFKVDFLETLSIRLGEVFSSELGMLLRFNTPKLCATIGWDTYFHYTWVTEIVITDIDCSISMARVE